MLADAGADVVGLNCIRGPRTMLPLIERIVAAVDVPVAALPVPYRTSEKEPTFQSLRDPNCDCLPSEMPFPVALDPMTCNRFEMAEFAKAAYALGARYLGICCGAMPHHDEHDYFPPMVNRSPSRAAVMGPEKRVAAPLAGSEVSTGG